MKRYIVSSVVTFVTGFALAIYPMLSDISLDNVSKATVVAFLFAGVRAGVKALIEFFFIPKATETLG